VWDLEFGIGILRPKYHVFGVGFEIGMECKLNRYQIMCDSFFASANVKLLSELKSLWIRYLSIRDYFVYFKSRRQQQKVICKTPISDLVSACDRFGIGIANQLFGIP